MLYLQSMEATARQLARDEAEAAAIVVKALDMALHLSDLWPDEDRREAWLISLAHLAHRRILATGASAALPEKTEEWSKPTHFPDGFPIPQRRINANQLQVLPPTTKAQWVSPSSPRLLPAGALPSRAILWSNDSEYLSGVISVERH